jgi:hypothetical protein
MYQGGVQVWVTSGLQSGNFALNVKFVQTMQKSVGSLTGLTVGNPNYATCSLTANGTSLSATAFKTFQFSLSKHHGFDDLIDDCH